MVILEVAVHDGGAGHSMFTFGLGTDEETEVKGLRELATRSRKKSFYDHKGLVYFNPTYSWELKIVLDCEVLNMCLLDQKMMVVTISN